MKWLKFRPVANSMAELVDWRDLTIGKELSSKIVPMSEVNALHASGVAVSEIVPGELCCKIWR